MRLLTYSHEGTIRFGAAVGSGVVDLSQRLPEFTTLRSLLAAGARHWPAAQWRVRRGNGPMNGAQP